jgi:hypothetical protein
MLLFKELLLRMSKVKNISPSLINIFLLINLRKENVFQIFKESILEEEFIIDSDKEILKDLYISVKKLINKLNTISRIFKFKKSVKYDINTDLHLNSLDILPNNEKMMLLENNTLYNFKLRDLISCWKLALLNSHGLFPKPLKVKNPYTNLHIKTHNLYNIYFNCLNMYVNLPMCITIFFKCNMNIGKYQSHYYTTLKEVAIINFIRNNNYYELFEQVLNLLHDNRKLVNYTTFTNYCSISTRTKAVNTFKPMLMNYLLSKFSCNPIVKEQKLNILKKQLIAFVKLTPDFGFERGFDIMRYVPLAERPSMTTPPPPPPNLVSQIRNRRRTRIVRNSFNMSISDSESDESIDLDIVESIEQAVQQTSIPPPPPPPQSNIVVPPPPPPPTVILPIRRPVNPPPPPPPNITINTDVNPFITRNQLSRTPINRSTHNTRQNIASLNNNLRLNIRERRIQSTHIQGLRFLR